ncbi:hypothetical protein HB992_09745 [Listeria seeligeri]|uniref:distal tail protein Dit n=1 Tax=Listeria seeligeri TaxID=1640 RepID=UPI00162AA689|nr:distal tail protein Dit [Listeria seeligeri]MBC1734951.1 hypothetical protein [Listeria seeligeri]
MTDMGRFYYKNKWSSELGLLIEYNQTFPLPERAVNVVEVIGLDEAVIIDQGYYKNVIISFPVKLVPQRGRTVKEQIHEIATWLYSSSYEQLITPDDRDYYRMVVYTSSSDFEEEMEKYGKGTINFSAKPYRYSRLGNKAITILTKGTKFNNDGATTKPIVRVYASGDVDLYINTQKMTLRGLNGFIELDSFMMTAKDAAGGNISNRVTSYPFLTLEHGSNTVTWTGGALSKIEIIPRWQKL